METVEAAGEKRTSENYEKKTEWRMERSNSDSENARAKGYEMKFSSHPFCVSEGIPVRQEVPSWNRRKRKSGLRKKRTEERTSRRRRRERRTSGGGNGGRARPYEAARHRTRGGFRDREG